MRFCVFAPLVLLAFLAFIEKSFGCTCLPSHPQRQYCDAKFAIVGRILHVREIPFPGNAGIKERRYIVRVYKVFKGPCRKKTTIHIYTTGSSAACGINLPKGHTYLLTGGMFNGKYRISSCGWIRKWKGVSHATRNMLRRKVYDKHCGCGKTIATCSSRSCGKLHNVCKWYSIKPIVGNCRRQYSYCASVHGKCVWRNWYGWRKCRWPNKKHKTGYLG